MEQSFFQLAYISQATNSFSTSELADLLSLSRKNNLRDEITGFLIYCEDSFFQVVEGNKEKIDGLYAKLIRDTRHNRINRLVYRYTDKRLFTHWSMAFKSIDSADEVAIEGYSEFLNKYHQSEALETIPFQASITETYVTFLIMSFRDICLKEYGTSFPTKD